MVNMAADPNESPGFRKYGQPLTNGLSSLVVPAGSVMAMEFRNSGLKLLPGADAVAKKVKTSPGLPNKCGGVRKKVTVSALATGPLINPTMSSASTPNAWMDLRVIGLLPLPLSK